MQIWCALFIYWLTGPISGHIRMDLLIYIHYMLYIHFIIRFEVAMSLQNKIIMIDSTGMTHKTSTLILYSKIKLIS